MPFGMREYCLPCSEALHHNHSYTFGIVPEQRMLGGQVTRERSIEPGGAKGKAYTYHFLVLLMFLNLSLLIYKRDNDYFKGNF